MKTRIILSALAIMFSLQLMAQTKDYSAELKKDIVKVVNGNYTSEDYYLITMADGSSSQVKMVANAPQSVISRDYFVAIITTQGIGFLSILFAANDVAPTIKELDSLIGVADVTITLNMAKNGMQVLVSNYQGTDTQTLTWDQIFN